jgi:quinol monooxygenase YgiN
LTFQEMSMFVRISKARYPADRHDLVAQRLADSATILVPAIRALPGCLSYHAGCDPVTNSMVNVSTWDTLEHAQAMASLAAMQALAQDFLALGVEFERPIANYPVSWTLDSA